MIVLPRDASGFSGPSTEAIYSRKSFISRPNSGGSRKGKGRIAMILYIVRHGIAVDRGDPKSPPKRKGRSRLGEFKKTRSAALGLEALGVKPTF